jgi:hypothetical protein
VHQVNQYLQEIKTSEGTKGKGMGLTGASGGNNANISKLIPLLQMGYLKQSPML